MVCSYPIIRLADTAVVLQTLSQRNFASQPRVSLPPAITGHTR